MFRLLGRVLLPCAGFSLVAAAVGGYGVLQFADSYHIRLPFGIASLFEGATVLQVTDIRRSGDHYVSVRYRITAGDRLHVDNHYGLDHRGLHVTGEPRWVGIMSPVAETIKDLSLLVDPNDRRNPDHMIEIRRNGDRPFQADPDTQAAAMILLRTVERFSPTR